jgi:hypothetical protein
MKTIIFYQLLLLIITPLFVNSQPLTITGYVKNHITGEGIENASVFDSVSGIGTITDKGGFFKLILKPGTANLLFSNPGFNNEEKVIDLKKAHKLEVTLKPMEQTRKPARKDSLSQANSASNEGTAMSIRRKFYVF